MKIVIKVGTSSLVDDDNLNKEFISKLCKQIADIMNQGHSVALVTSGAVGLGRTELKTRGKTELAKDKSICASIGQHLLMNNYEQEFSQHGILIGQTLLAGKDDYKKELAHLTLNKSMNGGILQIINANDTVYDKQMRIGDNDTLSAEVARMVKADKLVLITDTDRLHIRNADGTLGDGVDEIKSNQIKDYYIHTSATNVLTENARKKRTVMGLLKGDTSHYDEAKARGAEIDGQAASGKGTGGMVTKLDAAAIATKTSDTYIVSNQEVENLTKLVNGENVQSTHFSKAKVNNLIQFSKNAIKSLKEKII